VRLRATYLRRRTDDDLDEELRYHLDRRDRAANDESRHVTGSGHAMPPKRALGNATSRRRQAREAIAVALGRGLQARRRLRISERSKRGAAVRRWRLATDRPWAFGLLLGGIHML